MNQIPNTILIEFKDLNLILNHLEKNDSYPVIDTEALLSFIIDNCIAIPEDSIGMITNEIIENEILSSRFDIQDEELIKLDNTIYNLVLSIKKQINQILLNENNYCKYQFKRRMYNNCVILVRT